MTAAITALMPIGARFAAIMLTASLDRITEVNDTQTGFASAFHLSYGCHFPIPLVDLSLL
jgi:hypothetical protein